MTKVLYVEHNDDNLYMLKTRLELRGGFEVLAAEDSEKGCRLAATEHPDVILMDLTMPLMDGPECLAALRELLPDSRVLVVSALSDRSTALKAMMNGAHGFLLKPFSDQQLVESLQELLA